jgi:hypothetical protein
VEWDEIQKFLGGFLAGSCWDERVGGGVDLVRLFKSGINQFLSFDELSGMFNSGRGGYVHALDRNVVKIDPDLLILGFREKNAEKIPETKISGNFGSGLNDFRFSVLYDYFSACVSVITEKSPKSLGRLLGNNPKETHKGMSEVFFFHQGKFSPTLIHNHPTLEDS